MDGLLRSLTYHPGHPLLYNSVLFFLLFTGCYAVYALCAHSLRARNRILLLFSLYFYYLLSGPFVLLLAGMAGTDFVIGQMMPDGDEKHRSRLRNLSLVINLG